MKFKHIFAILSTMIIFVGCTSPTKISLAGEWQASLDSLDKLSIETLQSVSTKSPISLPGTTDEARIGVKADTTLAMTKDKLSYLTRDYSYIGAAWYERNFDLPNDWIGERVELTLERVLWRSDVWINGVKVDGFAESLIAPHRYEVGKYLKAGENSITIKIDNRKQHSNSDHDLAHAYTNHTQTIWNGIIGEISIEKRAASTIEGVAVSTDFANRKLSFTVDLNTESQSCCEISYDVTLRSTGESQYSGTLHKDLVAGASKVTIEESLKEDAALWSEFSPELYDLTISATFNGEIVDSRKESFGLRDVTTDGNKMFINGKPLFLRGTLECCIFPLTGHPPVYVEDWKRLYTSAREWGLNHLRFHSWCPPKAAFEAADEIGFYLQVELPFWTLDIGKDRPSMNFMRREGDLILSEYGNHPSFVFLCLGNELQGDYSELADLMKYYKAKDQRRLYTTTAFTFEKGHGLGPEPDDDFFITQWTEKGWVRGQGVFNSESPTFDNHYEKSIEGVDVPLITHEIGQYSVYPQMSEIEKYTGVLNPLNFKSIKADLEQKGLLDKAEMYTKSSGRFASILYKEEIERALKTDGISGFQLLDLHDFPGQGTAIVGLLDAFWDSKNVIDAATFREFSNPVTPLLYFPKATYTNDEKFSGSVAISNFGEQTISNPTILWRVNDTKGVTLKSGEIAAADMPLGFNGNIGAIEFSLSDIKEAQRLEIEVAIKDTEYKNRWSIWSYPSEVDIDFGGIKYTRDFDEAKRLLSKGEKVLYNPSWKKIEGIEGKFVPVFWSPVHFPKQAGTMGLLTNPSHPALRLFPTDFHSDWQWWDLNTNSTTMIVDSIKGGAPIVEMIDNFANNRRLALLYEGSVGGGRLIISSIDLSTELDNRIVARQMLHSLLEYMSSEEFNATEIENIEVVRTFLKDRAVDEKESAMSIY